MSNQSTLLLEHHLRELKLPSFLRDYHNLAVRCAAEGVSHPDYLLRLAELELTDRHQRMVQRRIRAARFPATKGLDTFDFSAIPSVNQPLVMQLARCEYVEHHENIIAIGNSGTGKTHVALGLGLSACQRGLSVGFTTAAALVNELMEARDERAAAQPAEATGPPQTTDHRRVGLRPPLPHRGGTALRSLQPALRTGLRPGDHQPALRRVDPSLRFGAAHRRAAGPFDPPRAHHRDERRELPPQGHPAKRRRAISIAGSSGSQLGPPTLDQAHDVDAAKPGGTFSLRP